MDGDYQLVCLYQKVDAAQSELSQQLEGEESPKSNYIIIMVKFNKLDTIIATISCLSGVWSFCKYTMIPG